MIRDDLGCTDPRTSRQCVAMRVEHLDAVMAIEIAAYPAPWTRGNFIDSLTGGCTALCLFGTRASMLGYAVSMEGAGEVHLLNLTIAPPARGQGHARYLLGQLLAAWRSRGVEQAWLEVRVSNHRAQWIYQRFGFVQTGLRRAYYPAPAGAGSSAREDAITMGLRLSQATP